MSALWIRKLSELKAYEKESVGNMYDCLNDRIKAFSVAPFTRALAIRPCSLLSVPGQKNAKSHYKFLPGSIPLVGARYLVGFCTLQEVGS